MLDGGVGTVRAQPGCLVAALGPPGSTASRAQELLRSPRSPQALEAVPDRPALRPGSAPGSWDASFGRQFPRTPVSCVRNRVEELYVWQ